MEEVIQLLLMGGQLGIALYNSYLKIFRSKIKRKKTMSIANIKKTLSVNAWYAHSVNTVKLVANMVILVLILMKLIDFHIFSHRRSLSITSLIIEFIDSLRCKGHQGHSVNRVKCVQREVLMKRNFIWKSYAQPVSMVSVFIS